MIGQKNSKVDEQSFKKFCTNYNYELLANIAADGEETASL